MIHSLILATVLSVPAHPAHPVGSGAAGGPRVAAPAAITGDRRQATGDSDWVLLTRAQYVRPGPHLAPATRRLLRPGLLLHETGQRHGAFIRIYLPGPAGGKGWVLTSNTRPAQQPAGWTRYLIKFAAQQPRRPVRVTPPPSPLAAGSAPTAAPQTGAAPASAVQPAPAPVSDWQSRTPVQSIYFWASQYGVNGDLLLATARCESGLTAGAYNASGASGGLQFMPSTFASYAGQLSWDHTPSYWNFDDSARVAAYMWSLGQQNQWTCYGIVTGGF